MLDHPRARVSAPAVRDQARLGPGVHDLGGSGMPVLVLHATGFCAGAYRPLAADMAAGAHVWAVDLRGHGDAPTVTDGDFSYASMARDLIAALIRLDVGPVHLFGHSMGGAVGLLAAVERPDLFRSAFVYEPAILADGVDLTDQVEVFAHGVRTRRAVFTNRDEAMRTLALKAPFSRFRADALACFVESGMRAGADGRVRLCCDPADEAECYRQNRQAASRFRDVQLPLTVACGRTGASLVSLSSLPLSSAVPHATTVYYPHLDHFGPLEAPSALAGDAMRMFASLC